MQPYFFPYIGYWQLMNAVDEYVVYDDVNYIKGGWINRNRILVNGTPQYINLVLSQPSPYKKINEIEIGADERIIKKTLSTIKMNYGKAPYFKDVYPLLEQLILNMKGNLANYLFNSFMSINSYLDIRTKLLLSSDITKDDTLKGQDKVIEICKKLNAEKYYNAIGGMDLYSYSDFMSNGIELCFLKTDNIVYKQYNDAFQPNLSIIDVMMFNSVQEIKGMLEQYSLISEE